MCLLVKKGTEKIILSKDMIVYKKLLVSGFESFSSIYFDHIYNPNILEKTVIKTSFEYFPWVPWDTRAIEEVSRILGYSMYTATGDNIRNQFDTYGQGFHFATSIERIGRIDLPGMSKNLAIIECTIPAGSEVILDTDGLGISNQIIINKKID